MAAKQPAAAGAACTAQRGGTPLGAQENHPNVIPQQNRNALKTLKNTEIPITKP